RPLRSFDVQPFRPHPDAQLIGPGLRRAALPRSRRQHRLPRRRAGDGRGARAVAADELGLDRAGGVAASSGGWLLIAAGVVAILEAFGRFVAEGVGTPAPLAPTERLV